MKRRVARRVLLRGAALAGGGAALAACAGGGQGTGVSPAASSGQPAGRATAPAHLVWLIRSDMGTIINDWHQKAIAAFQQQSPNVTLETSGATSADYNTKATAMFVAGTPPDVLGNYAGGFGSFVVNDALADVTAYATRDKLDLKTFEPAALDAIRRQGKLLGLPVAHNPWILIYNRSLLQERGVALPPTSWKDRRWNVDALLGAAQKLTTATGDPATETWGIVHPDGQMGTQACWLWGVDPFNAQGGPDKSTAYQTGKVTEVNYLQPRVIEAIQTIDGDLPHKHKVAPTPAGQTAFVANRRTPLHTGRLGFWANGGWNLSAFKDSPVTFQWGVAPLVYGPGTAGASTTGLFNDSFHVVKGSKVPDAAFAFVAFLATGDRAAGYTEGGGYFPANRALYDAYYDGIVKTTGFGMTKAQLQEVMQGGVENGYPSPGKTLHRQRDYDSAYGKAIAPIRNGEQPASIGLRDVQQQTEAVSREG